MNVLLITIGASLGAPARFLIDQYFRKFTDKPLGTFLVNVVGSFLIGLTYSLDDSWQNVIAFGFAGCFTTWSTFIVDLYLGFELKHYKTVAINLFASLGFGLIAAYFGYLLVS
jgi:CrcB protein